MTRRRLVVVAAVLTAALAVTPLLAGPAWAGPPTDQLRARVDRVLKVLEDPELKKDGRSVERQAAVRDIAHEIFDFTETTRRSLGRHWQGRTPAERAEVVRLFTELLERSYIGKIDLYSGEKVAFVGETVEGEQATVRTKIVTRQGTEVPVDYRMHRRDDRWQAYDVLIEGVSLVANYRTQFNKIVQASSFEGLIARLQVKQDLAAEAAEGRRQASRK